IRLAARCEFLRFLELEPGFLDPFGHLLVGKAEAQMRMVLTQELVAMRREIDDHQSSGGPEEARRLMNRKSRFFEIMEHLVHGHEVEGVALDRRRVEITESDLRIRHAC